MTENVKVTVIGTHAPGTPEEDVIKSTCPGQYYEKGEKQYVIFEEEQEGFSEKIKTMIKFTRKSVEITKKGLIHSHMIFEQGGCHETDYATPYGTMKMEVDTSSLIMLYTEEYIRMDIAYTLRLGGNEDVKSKIVIKIKPVS